MIPLFLAEKSEESLARERVFRYCSDTLDYELELVQRFRLSRSAILRITEIIEFIILIRLIDHAALPHVQVCVALQLSATFQIICVELVHVSKPSACRYIRVVALRLQSAYSKL